MTVNPIRCQIEIKAVPNASRSEVVGWIGDALKVRLKASPVDGKANAELCRFLATALKLPKGAVSVTVGASSRLKRVELEGISTKAVLERYPR
jgi:uncharacterized protein (TIGR00251 family)